MNRSITSYALLVAFVASHAQPAAAAEQIDEAPLLKIIRSQDASDHDRAVACQQLAIVGSSRAVPDLEALLTDKHFSHYARYALQNIPSADAGDALRRALDQVQGDQLVGVINSIAARQDRDAVEQLVALSKSSNQKVSAAAVAALVHIDLDRAASLLASVDPKSRVQLADVLLSCAYRLADRGRGPAALALLDCLEGADATRQARAAAVLGRVRYSEPNQAASLAKSLLARDEDWKFTIGLQAVVEGGVDNGAKLLADAIDQDQPERQVQILRALRGMGERSAAESARTAARSDIAAVRVEGIKSLGVLGDASDAPLLMRLAHQDNQFSQVAREALAEMDDEGVDRAIVVMLRDGSSDSRAIAAELIGQRRIIEGAHAIIQSARSAKDSATRVAALEAAGRLAVGDTLPPLLELAIGAQSPKERRLARQASLAAASRVSDREAAAAAVADQIDVATGDQIGYLLDVLAVVGGPRALESVVAIAEKQDQSAQNEATRVLGNWPSADAAPALLRVADSDNHYAVRALRGYLRIARQFAVPESERLAMCRSALRVASRDEERLLAIQVLERIPSVAALELATAELAEDRLGKQASESVLAIAEAIALTYPDAAAKASSRVIKTGGSEEVLARARKLITE
ncbi:hypothetical protein Pla175_23030 [Pirellulimonas nuda]|uniref:HEAT repeat protein n=1 Tax=Pirellulimonas nuda TaxID=2528009 RepID=A0A518DBS9_9BACT|nr:hypothetical protein [Pirellulimonas nuda]QDU88919.1 hypothetical protein Pla175_23030 [Pirellulimonas nuda]